LAFHDQKPSKGKKHIISVFLVLILVSSLSAAAFAAPNANLVFAKKHGSSSGGGSSSSDNGGGGSSSSDNGGGGSSSSDNGGGGSSSSGGGSSSSGGGSSSSDNGGGGTAGGSSDGGGGGGSSNMATTSPSTSTTQQTCPDDLILNSDGKCVPKNQSGTPMQTESTGNTTTTAQMKTGNTGGNAGTNTPTSTTSTTPPSSTSMQTGNTGGNAGAKCTGLSQFDPTTGICASGNPSTTTQTQAGNTGGYTFYGRYGLSGPASTPSTGTATTTTATPTTTTTQTNTTQTQAGNTGGNAGAKCTGLSQFDPTTGICASGNPSTTTQTQAGAPATLILPYFEEKLNGSSTSGITSTPVKVTPVNGKCPVGSHSIGTEDDGITPWCVEDNPATGTQAATTGSGTTPGANANTSSTTSTPKQVEVPPLTSGKCPYGSSSVGSSGNAGQPGTGSTICISTPGATTSTETGFHVDASGMLTKDENPDGSCAQGTEHRGPSKICYVVEIPATVDGSCINGWTHFPGADPNFCYLSKTVNPPTSEGSGTTTNTGTGGGTTSTPMTTPMKTGGGTTNTGTGAGTTTTGTGTTAPTNGTVGTGTSTSTSTTTTTTKIINNNNIVRGGQSSVGVGSTQAPTTSTTITTPSVTYVNIPDKITIRYPSTWTKTEFADNPSIPVIFNAPINGSTTAAKTSLMININQLTPASATPDSYTQQQINALTNSSVIKYTITDTNSKVLTPPSGIASYREISYNGIKNSTVNSNNISTQIPLKGTAIFFVNGNTGYSLLYLAKQTEYNQNLPTVQQMINTFQINATSSSEGVGSGSGATGGSSNSGGNNG
jgi:hypothetical protein